MKNRYSNNSTNMYYYILQGHRYWMFIIEVYIGEEMNWLYDQILNLNY